MGSLLFFNVILFFNFDFVCIKSLSLSQETTPFYFIGSNRSRNNGWKITKGEETLYLRIEDEEEEKNPNKKRKFWSPP